MRLRRIRLLLFLFCLAMMAGLALPALAAKDERQTVVVTEKEVNVRQGPGTPYRVIMKVDQGETYRVVEEKDGWVKVQVKPNQAGWVAKPYIAYVRKQAVVAEDGLRARTAPSLSGDVIGRLSQSQLVYVVETEDDWVKVVTSSLIGWVSSSYLSSYQHQETTTKTGWITADSLNVRAQPSLAAEPVGKVAYGEQVAITAEQGKWYQIRTDDGKVGWVASEYISTASKTASSFVTVLYPNVNIRALPSLESPVQAIAQNGERYRVLGKIGNWYEIELPSGTTGYIAGWLVSASTGDQRDSKTLEGKTIVIDAGHGGKDSGTISKTGLMEKTLTLRTAQLLKEKLEPYGANVVLTRTDDRYLTLQERVETAYRYHADAFISIHYNSAKDPNVAGTTIYYYDLFSDYLFACSFREPFSHMMAIPFRGISFGDYYVIRENKLPSVLMELGYLSNPTEASIIATDSYQQQVTDAIVNGVRNYFE
ncbi:SH3 domain-containing protein [Saccharococcus thermophilus]|uniref:N-acetylmuramoyl-L-alanine amidase n=1 Tax=Saccharococcus thermophilus TaxID=29396 RepID=A0A846MBF3_9BACL|nr:SH3 domain-containing protein [Saccharococcus thermophilus]NIK13902.1 N-acetylmuramoyl-L-alanine amidase [Saccharococcus thermophilus]